HGEATSPFKASAPIGTRTASLTTASSTSRSRPSYGNHVTGGSSMTHPPVSTSSEGYNPGAPKKKKSMSTNFMLLKRVQRYVLRNQSTTDFIWQYDDHLNPNNSGATSTSNASFSEVDRQSRWNNTINGGASVVSSSSGVGSVSSGRNLGSSRVSSASATRNSAGARAGRSSASSSLSREQQLFLQERDGFLDYLWQLLPITPRVSGICKLVPKCLR
ncbi:unnamed protein product, partial [Amoebophrya sp. A25]